MILGNLVTRFTADLTDLHNGIAQYGKEIGEAERKNEDFNKGLSAMRNSAVMAIGAVTAVAYGVYNMVRSFGEAAQQLKDMSITTGMSTDKLQELEYAAIRSGTPIASLQNGINEFTLSLAEANDETSQAAKDFRQLGVNIKEGSPEEVFDRTIRQLSQVADETEKARLAQDLFGKNWKVYIPFIEDYIASQGKLKDQVILTTDELSANADAWSTLQTNIKIGWDAAGKAFADYTLLVKSYNDNYLKSLQDQVAAGKLTASQYKALSGQDYAGGVKGTGGREGVGVEPAAAAAKTLAENPYANLSYDEAQRKYIKEITIPQLEAALEKERQTGTAATIAEASLKLLEARKSLIDSEKDSQKDLNSAQEDYYDVAKKINDLKKDQNLTTKEYIMDMRAAGGDVASQRSLTLGYRKSLLRSESERQDLMGDLSTAGARAIAVQKGDTATGDFILQIDNVQLSKDYPIDKMFKDYEAYAAQQRRSAGVRS